MERQARATTVRVVAPFNAVGLSLYALAGAAYLLRFLSTRRLRSTR